MVSMRELRRMKSALQSADKLLTVAAVMQLPIVAIVVVRLLGFDWRLPEIVVMPLWVASSLLAIVGYWRVSRQPMSWDDVHSVSIPDFIRNGKGGFWVVFTVRSLFFAAFLFPVVNLVFVGIAKARAGTKIRQIDQAMQMPRRG